MYCKYPKFCKAAFRKTLTQMKLGSTRDIYLNIWRRGLAKVSFLNLLEEGNLPQMFSSACKLLKREASFGNIQECFKKDLPRIPVNANRKDHMHIETKLRHKMASKIKSNGFNFWYLKSLSKKRYQSHHDFLSFNFFFSYYSSML